jgi:ferredoxin
VFLFTPNEGPSTGLLMASVNQHFQFTVNDSMNSSKALLRIEFLASRSCVACHACVQSCPQGAANAIMDSLAAVPPRRPPPLPQLTAPLPRTHCSLVKDRVVCRAVVELSRVEADPGVPHAVWIALTPPGAFDAAELPLRS